MLNGLTKEEFAKLVTSVGVHRKNRHLRPIEVSQLLGKALEFNSLLEIANACLLKTTGDLSRFISLQKIPTELQKLISFGKQRGCISFSVAAEIAKLEQQDQISELAKFSLEKDLSKNDVIAIVQRIKRGGVSVKAAVDEILKLKPIIEEQHLLVASINCSDDEAARRIIRKNIAKLVGSDNLLSVMVSGGRVAILVRPEAFKSKLFTKGTDPASLDQFIADLVESG